jgi:hypothetical protein
MVRTRYVTEPRWSCKHTNCQLALCATTLQLIDWKSSVSVWDFFVVSTEPDGERGLEQGWRLQQRSTRKQRVQPWAKWRAMAESWRRDVSVMQTDLCHPHRTTHPLIRARLLFDSDNFDFGTMPTTVQWVQSVT